MPFEPGSPTTRLRQKATATAKSAAAMAGTTSGTSEAQKKSSRSADVTSEVPLVTDAEVKAVTWTPPVVASPELQAAAGKASWRPMATSEQLPVKLSPSMLTTLPGTETQAVSVPPTPALMSSSSSAAASLRARSLYACAVCGFDAGGYVELAQHMMTSHYSVMMTSGTERQAAAAAAAATPFKRRWQVDKNEPVTTSWTPPPRLPTPQLDNLARRPVTHPDERREFLQPGFQTSSMPLFHQPSPPLGWGFYRSLPPMSTAFGSLSTLRAELDAMRSSVRPSKVRTEEAFRTSDHHIQRDDRVKSAKSDLVDASQRTAAPPQDFTNVTSHLHCKSTKASSDCVEHASASMPVTSGLPLDLSTKISTPGRDQLLDSVQSEVKRSRRKGKAFKVDADRLNSGSRDEDLADVDPVGRYNSETPEMNSRWRISENPVTATGEQTRSSGGSTQVLDGRGLNLTDDRDVARCEESQWSGLGCSGSSGTTSQRTTATSVNGSGSSSTPYHECRHCGLGFRDGELFAMHMDFHGRQDPFTCNFCGAATGNQVEFFLHVAHAPHNVRPVYVV